MSLKAQLFFSSPVDHFVYNVTVNMHQAGISSIFLVTGDMHKAWISPVLSMIGDVNHTRISPVLLFVVLMVVGAKLGLFQLLFISRSRFKKVIS